MTSYSKAPAMSKRSKLLLVTIACLVCVAFLARKAQQEINEHRTICLDDRVWRCTQWRTVPVGMAIRSECTRWEQASDR